MKALILLADGFEEGEALVTADVLMRAGTDVTLLAVGESPKVNGAHGIAVAADKTLSDLGDYETDVIVLPGGVQGTENLANSFQVKSLIEKAVDEGIYVAAICAAPSVLGRMGFLDGRNIACYPGFERYMPAANVTGEKVETDDIFITAEGMGVTLNFALTIVEKLFGVETAEKVKQEIRMA